MNEGSEIKAVFMMEDLMLDLLTTGEIKLNPRGKERSTRVTSRSGMIDCIQLILNNLKRSQESLETNSIHKVGSLVLSLKNQNTEVNIIFLQSFDRATKSKPENYKKWLAVKAIFTGDEKIPDYDPSTFRRQEDCFNQFLQENLTGTKTLFIAIADSKPENFRDNLPMLEEASKLKMEINSLSSEKLVQPQTSLASYHALKQYSKQIIEEIDNTISDIQQVEIFIKLKGG